MPRRRRAAFRLPACRSHFRGGRSATTAAGRDTNSIQAILWDQDGLLVDTERLYFLANRETLKREGVVLRREDFVRLFMKSNQGMGAIAAGQGWSAGKLEEVRAARNRLHERLLRTRTRALPWARTAVRRLARTFRMVLVTSSYRRHVMLLDRKFGLLRHMEFVVCEGDFERSKPDPDPYLIALRRLGLPASKCVAIEDSERGFAAARAAGLRCIVVPNSMTRGGDFRGAWKVLETLKELPDVLCPPSFPG